MYGELGRKGQWSGRRLGRISPMQRELTLYVRRRRRGVLGRGEVFLPLGEEGKARQAKRPRSLGKEMMESQLVQKWRDEDCT